MGITIDTPAEVANRITHFMSVGPRREDAVLHAFQLRGSHHFHGFRDFLRFFDGIDLPSDRLKAWHVSYPDWFMNEEAAACSLRAGEFERLAHHRLSTSREGLESEAHQ
jgi:hypothetical protein